MDGLPIYKISKCEFWPVLGNIHEIPEIKPLVIGIYSGTGKPADLSSYLQTFVSETKQVLQDGIFVKLGKDNVPRSFSQLEGTIVNAFLLFSTVSTILNISASS